MSERIVLELPESLAESARAVAARTNRPMEAVVLEWLDRVASDLPMEFLSDEQVIAMRDIVMDEGQQAELSTLLSIRREHPLREAEQSRLDRLLDVYRGGMIRKARALKASVDRGLQPPLSAL